MRGFRGGLHAVRATGFWNESLTGAIEFPPPIPFPIWSWIQSHSAELLRLAAEGWRTRLDTDWEASGPPPSSRSRPATRSYCRRQQEAVPTLRPVGCVLREQQQRQVQVQVLMPAASRSHSSTGARATWWRSTAQCSSVRLRRSANVWLSTSETPTSVGRLPRCRAPIVPQRVPDASVYRGLFPTRGSAAPFSIISATTPFGRAPGSPASSSIATACPRGADLVYVWFIPAKERVLGAAAGDPVVPTPGPRAGCCPRLRPATR